MIFVIIHCSLSFTPLGNNNQDYCFVCFNFRQQIESRYRSKGSKRYL